LIIPFIGRLSYWPGRCVDEQQHGVGPAAAEHC
jgi:hypothetical protein